jgi:hypothetical protein
VKTVRIFVTAQKILLHALGTSVLATELTHDFSAKNRGIVIRADTACFLFHLLCLFRSYNGRLAGFLGFDRFGGHDLVLSVL